MDPRPIGVFDSGIGGLMAVRMLRHLLPGEPILYLGDTARMPYGDRPAGEIDRLTGELTGWLLRQNVPALMWGRLLPKRRPRPPETEEWVWPPPVPPSAAGALRRR